jgi:hypothetical protein
MFPSRGRGGNSSTVSDLFGFDLQELIAVAKREVRLRRQVYPNRVSTKRMTQQQADREIACMERIAEVLEELADTKKAPPRSGA